MATGSREGFARKKSIPRSLSFCRTVKGGFCSKTGAMAAYSHEGIVRVKTHPELPEDWQQLPLHVPRDGVVHPLINRRRLPPVHPLQMAHALKMFVARMASERQG